MIWVGSLSIHGFSGPWRCMCQFWNQKSVKFLLSHSVDKNIEKVSLFLHCYFEVLSNSYSVPG